MLHGVDRYIKKLFLVLSLLVNSNCKILYPGKNEIDDTKTLYPTNTYSYTKNNFQFVSKVEKVDCKKTLFVTIEIQNPANTNVPMRNCSEKIKDNLKDELKNVMTSKPETNILNFALDFSKVQKIKKKKIQEEINDIKDKIINKKYENIFTNIVVNVVYSGAMKGVAQSIIQDFRKTQSDEENNLSGVNEFCFNPHEQQIENEEIIVDKNWQNTFLKNFYTERDENLFRQLTIFFCKKDEEKFKSLNDKITKEDFIAELKKLDQDEDVKNVLKFLEDEKNSFVCYISDDHQKISVESVEEVAEKIVAGCFLE